MVETMNNIGNRQPDSNAGCSKQKGVKNKQTRQLVLWIGALIVGAVLGIFGKKERKLYLYADCRSEVGVKKIQVAVIKGCIQIFV